MASKWQPMNTAPRDKKPIRARIPGYGGKNIIRWSGDDAYMNDDEESCGCWEYVSGPKEPKCWHDGVCWATNADHQASVQPTGWQPIAEA